MKWARVFGLAFLIPAVALLGEQNEIVHWHEAYRIFRVKAKSLKQLPFPYRIVSKRCRRFCRIRVPAEALAEAKEFGLKEIKNPPFRQIYPEALKQRDAFEGYKNYKRVVKALRKLRKRYPRKTKLVKLGQSGQWRPLYALKVFARSREKKPAVLLNAAHHGNEVLSIEYVLDAARYLLKNNEEFLANLIPSELKPNQAGPSPPDTSGAAEAQALLRQFDFYFVPVVNPDGLHLFWNRSVALGRKNARGVDLNRNYPFQWNSGIENASSDNPRSVYYRGPAPASEKETRAMMKLASDKHFVFSISFHTYATKVLYPYTIDNLRNPRPDYAKMLASQIVQSGVSHRIGKPYAAASQLYSVDGTDQDWLFHTFGTLAFIFEGSHQNPPWEIARKSIEGMRPMVRAALRLLLKYPTMRYHLPKGARHSTKWLPSGIQFFEQESWGFRKDGMAFFFPAIPDADHNFSIRLADEQVARVPCVWFPAPKCS